MQAFETPFPHVVIEDFLSQEVVRQINQDWPTNWTKKSGKTSVKWHTQRIPDSARSVIESIDVALVEKATGISGLFADSDLYGAGLHCIPRGGYLKTHIDYNVHPKGWHRRVNLLIYLNERWEDSWGGHLQLGLENPKLIAPIGGRCVIFETNDQSWHGHPAPLDCPADVQRRSLALYYYTPEPPQAKAHTTIYKAA
ncbi:MAG: 2OG-Fe(II) oxygenase [Gammaproteobacteria bacterium]|nr:2OG-Fe(II) oxygenase [Gammaproteobacteria bacterium]